MSQVTSGWNVTCFALFWCRINLAYSVWHILSTLLAVKCGENKSIWSAKECNNSENVVIVRAFYYLVTLFTSIFA